MSDAAPVPMPTPPPPDVAAEAVAIAQALADPRHLAAYLTANRARLVAEGHITPEPPPHQTS